MAKSVFGIVETRIQAERIIEALHVGGVPSDEISVLFPDTRGSNDFAHEHHTKAPEGAVAGVSAGGVVGGTLGLLAGIGALALPGAGPLIAAGPLLAALSGAAAGAAVGGVGGALVGLGVPEIEAKAYEGKLQRGNILIAIQAQTSEAEKRARRAFEQYGAHDISLLSDAPLPKVEHARL